MNLSKKDWNNYINRMSRINKKAGQLMRAYVEKYGIENSAQLIAYANALVTKYGEGSAELAAQLYDAIAQAEGVAVKSAVPAEVADYGTVAKAVNGTKNNLPVLASAVSRLVKQAGADTMLQNAQRDGAEFAWIPSGDSCAFCITLASRGWQKQGKAARQGIHAQHIHANCDCNYTVRFNKNTTVEGYDPEQYKRMYDGAEGATPQEKINTLRRQQRLAQEYRKVERGSAETFKQKKGREILAKRVTSYTDEVYISDNASIKPRALHQIKKNTDEAIKKWNVTNRPKIVIVSNNELGGVGLYDAVNNTVYYIPEIADKKIMQAHGGTKITEFHEMWHAKQAEEYQKKYGKITKENKGKYIERLCKKCKKIIDREGITLDNVGEISQYAERSYLGGRYDEVEAELRANRRK